MFWVQAGEVLSAVPGIWAQLMLAVLQLTAATWGLCLELQGCSGDLSQWVLGADTPTAMPHHSPVDRHHSGWLRVGRGWRKEAHSGIHSSPGKRWWDLTRAVDVGHMKGTNSVEASVSMIQHFWRISQSKDHVSGPGRKPSRSEVKAWPPRAGPAM